MPDDPLELVLRVPQLGGDRAPPRTGRGEDERPALRQADGSVILLV
jgi:hypothetical protein